MVIPNWDGGSLCWVDEEVFDNSVEASSDCGAGPGSAGLHAEIGQGDSCTLTNTVFYEGIPALSRNGMMLLALLMLGMGLVGYRHI